jgi:prepilin-type N-terminal cleavage/methylation domain-containing protein
MRPNQPLKPWSQPLGLSADGALFQFQRHPPNRRPPQPQRSVQPRRGMRTVNRENTRGGRAAFSLMELLVVISVVALLLALLLPALSGAREKAKKASCQSVLRQVYVLTRMYADDHGGALPLRSAIFPEGKVLDCPSTPHSGPVVAERDRGYSWNTHYFHHLETRNIDARWVLLGDRRPWHDPKRTWEPPPAGVWTGGHNLMYGDGHLAWERRSSPP